MENAASTIEFTLHAAGTEVRAALRRSRHGWICQVAGLVPGTGVGASARQALNAALQPLGEFRTRALLADLGLLEPSVAVVEMDRSLAKA